MKRFVFLVAVVALLAATQTSTAACGCRHRNHVGARVLAWPVHVFHRLHR